MEEQIMNMPAVALRGLTILPGMIAHFDISREPVSYTHLDVYKRQE